MIKVIIHVPKITKKIAKIASPIKPLVHGKAVEKKFLLPLTLNQFKDNWIYPKIKQVNLKWKKSRKWKKKILQQLLYLLVKISLKLSKDNNKNLNLRLRAPKFHIWIMKLQKLRLWEEQKFNNYKVHVLVRFHHSW